MWPPAQIRKHGEGYNFPIAECESKFLLQPLTPKNLKQAQKLNLSFTHQGMAGFVKHCLQTIILCRILRSIEFRSQLTFHQGNIQGVVIFQSRKHSSWNSLCWLSGFKNCRLLLIDWIQRHKYWGKAVTDPLEWVLTAYNNNVFIDRAITKEESISFFFFFFSEVSERNCFSQAAENSILLSTPWLFFFF